MNKICDLVQFYSPLSGGVKRYINDKMRFFGKRQDVEHVLIVPAEHDRVREVEGATVYEIRSPRLIGSASYRLLINRRKIREVLLSERPDLIEVGDPYFTAWIGLKAARKLGVPIISYYHSDYPRGFRRTVDRFLGPAPAKAFTWAIEKYLQNLYDRMDAVVVATKKYERLLGSFPLHNLVRIPLGADLERFKPVDSRPDFNRKLGIPEEAVLLLFAGRLAREKNIRSLVGMLDLLNRSETDRPYHLLLVGGGELGSWIQHESQIRHNLHYMPYVHDAAELAACYAAADLKVHAGMYETFGLSVLEAQACGTPAVVVRDSGLEDVIAHDPHSHIARSTLPGDLASEVLRFDPEQENAASRQARHDYVCRKFDSDATFEGMESLYRHMLNHQPVEAFSPERASASSQTPLSALGN